MLKSVGTVASAHFSDDPAEAEQLCRIIHPDVVISFGARAVVAPGSKVLSILSVEDQEKFHAVTDLVADGYLLDDELTPNSLEDGIARLVSGEMPLSTSLMRRIITRIRGSQRDSGLKPALTPREQETLVLLAEGLSNKQIARRLGISPHGAKRHVANVLAKLNCPNRTLAVAEAMRSGILAS
ncbi:hypothetical protein Lesp02_85520 [Lentzea sp. NBRC 105346]|uniref:response regulator transcription factor n=1 Tax=Lentzea sp. NBRC 105346 TaxID=3032205 RepID=UPI0024A5D447|nr:response regulator transcription factor [Lentzea sp. NBRC 105346]GLZ36365.1 hypothetical protein Lesp02_85520 [Lentzea sp. NBRC 105346]